MIVLSMEEVAKKLSLKGYQSKSRIVAVCPLSIGYSKGTLEGVLLGRMQTTPPPPLAQIKPV